MTDRVALVTGASSGIGRATAVVLARQGARVMAVARREERLAELARETGVHYTVCDLRTEEGCLHAVEETRRALGPVEILVNNAGLGSTEEGSVVDTPTRAWRLSMDVNLDAPYFLTREAARDMIERHWGRIVMVSSTAATLGAQGYPAYSAAKAGLLGFMRAVAADLAPHGVTCNGVLPGWIRTEMADRSAARESERRGVTVEEIWAERAASYDAGRTATAEEVAETVGFLCSAQSSGVSGQSITVALGGMW